MEILLMHIQTKKTEETHTIDWSAMNYIENPSNPLRILEECIHNSVIKQTKL